MDITTLGILSSDPQRTAAALFALKGMLRVPADCDGVGRATCVDAGVTLRRTPGAPKSLELHDAAADLAGNWSVLQWRRAADLRPSAGHDQRQLGPFRMRRYAAAVHGGPGTPEAATAQRETWLSALPDFLRRGVQGKSEGEAFFHAFLARLHGGRMFDAHEVSDAAWRESFAAMFSSGLPRHFTVLTGRHLWHLSTAESVRIRLHGIPTEAATQFAPAMVDSAAGRARLERARVTLLATGTSGEAVAVPRTEIPGVDVQVIRAGDLVRIGPDHECTVVGHDVFSAA